MTKNETLVRRGKKWSRYAVMGRKNKDYSGQLFGRLVAVYFVREKAHHNGDA